MMLFFSPISVFDNYFLFLHAVTVVLGDLSVMLD